MLNCLAKQLVWYFFLFVDQLEDTKTVLVKALHAKGTPCQNHAYSTLGKANSWIALVHVTIFYFAVNAVLDLEFCIVLFW